MKTIYRGIMMWQGKTVHVTDCQPDDRSVEAFVAYLVEQRQDLIDGRILDGTNEADTTWLRDLHALYWKHQDEENSP